MLGGHGHGQVQRDRIGRRKGTGSRYRAESRSSFLYSFAPSPLRLITHKHIHRGIVAAPIAAPAKVAGDVLVLAGDG